MNLLSSSYLGGGGMDQANGVAIEQQGDVASAIYVTGGTRSSDFQSAVTPTMPYGNSVQDAFVLKLDGSAQQPLYFAYLGGGAGASTGYGIAVKDGMAYVAGYTTDRDFPLVAPLQECRNQLYQSNGIDCLTVPSVGEDAILLKLNAAGTELLFSTYLGGNGSDSAFDIDLDPAGNAFITGRTRPPSGGETPIPYPTTPGAYQTMHGGGDQWDVFVSSVSADGSTLLYSTYIGGSGREYPNSLATAGANAFVTGTTWSASGFSSNPQLETLFDAGPGPDYWGNANALVLRLNGSGSDLDYWALVGGTDYDAGHAVAVDGAGAVYLAGETHSSDFWMSANQPGLNGVSDAFLVKFDDPLPIDQPEPAEPPIVEGTAALAFFSSNDLEVYRLSDGTLQFEKPFNAPTELVFEGWGSRIAVMDADGATVVDAANGVELHSYPGSYLDGAFRPTDRHDLALTMPPLPSGTGYRIKVFADTGFTNEIELYTGVLTNVEARPPRVAWSEDGSRLMAAYPVENEFGGKSLFVVEISVVGEELQVPAPGDYLVVSLPSDFDGILDAGYAGQVRMIATDIGLYQWGPAFADFTPTVQQDIQAADLSMTETGFAAALHANSGETVVYPFGSPAVMGPPLGAKEIAIAAGGERIAVAIAGADLAPGTSLPGAILIITLDPAAGAETMDLECILNVLKPHDPAFGGTLP